MDGAGRCAWRRNTSLDAVYLRQPWRMHHRAQRPHQSRPRGHARHGRDGRLWGVVSHRFAVARRACRGRHGCRHGRDPRRHLRAAACQRYCRRHRPHAVRCRACLLSRQAADRADRAAAAVDRSRLVERYSAASRCLAHQRVLYHRRRAGADSGLGAAHDTVGPDYPHRRRKRRCGVGDGLLG